MDWFRPSFPDFAFSFLSVLFEGIPFLLLGSIISGLIDVFVVPRTTDRVSRLVTPLKPLEAMAMEIPVVVSDLPPLREMVIDGETGLVFDPGDASALAGSISVLIEDDAISARLGESARRWVVEQRSWSRIAHLYSELYPTPA